MKLAIVCDWLVGTGGAERVVAELHKLYPDAPIYTSQYDSNPSVWHGNEWFKDADVRTLWLQKLPKSMRKFMPFLRALAFSRLNLSEFDIVISVSGAEAKSVKTGPNTTHICYLLSPTHYYWIRYDDYLRNPGFGRLDPLARIGLKLLVGPMRKWDYKAAQKPDHVIAISSHIQKMIEKYYGRQSDVIHPPVDVERFAGQSEEHRRGFVTAGRQTPYKRIDLAVQAFTQLDLPLLVLGNGPDHRHLRKLAGRKITFIKNPSDEEVAHYFKTSLAFIFPAQDDFGIVAVEALAAGTPVIAFKAGGALDYIEEGDNGLFFNEQNSGSLEAVVKTFRPEDFHETVVRNSAKNFSAKTFCGKIEKIVDKILAD